MINRRKFLQTSGSIALAAGFPFLARASANLESAMQESDLIYVTPIKSNGEESGCQSEIWFVADGTDMYVCTGTSSWRARAPRQGLDEARVWIGDVGVWTRSDGAYKNLPSLMADVTVIDDKSIQEKALELFGDKYTLQWILYGPRFRNGLEDGTRTLLRYRPRNR